jgi:hypothetical protein
LETARLTASARPPDPSDAPSQQEALTTPTPDVLQAEELVDLLWPDLDDPGRNLRVTLTTCSGFCSPTGFVDPKESG